MYFCNNISLQRYFIEKKHIYFTYGRLFCFNHTCNCVNMVSATSASRYHPRYQSRSSMYIRGLIPRNFAELAEVVPIAYASGNFCCLVMLITFANNLDPEKAQLIVGDDLNPILVQLWW